MPESVQQSRPDVNLFNHIGITDLATTAAPSTPPQRSRTPESSCSNPAELAELDSAGERLHIDLTDDELEIEP